MDASRIPSVFFSLIFFTSAGYRSSGDIAILIKKIVVFRNLKVLCFQDKFSYVLPNLNQLANYLSCYPCTIAIGSFFAILPLLFSFICQHL
jgi:hypothetical protein